MRKLLRVIVEASGAIACLLLAGMVLVLFAAIVLRQFGVLLPGHEEITTFAMVGMAFLGLPVAYRSGAHVRVETLLTRVSPQGRRRFDTGCVAVGAAVCLAFSYYAFWLCWDSWRFGDVSEGLLAIPRWIPQLPVFLGLLLFSLALLADLVALLGGGTASFEAASGQGATQSE